MGRHAALRLGEAVSKMEPEPAEELLQLTQHGFGTSSSSTGGSSAKKRRVLVEQKSALSLPSSIASEPQSCEAKSSLPSSIASSCSEADDDDSEVSSISAEVEASHRAAVRLEAQADSVAAKPLPSGRGELKHLVLKKPARALAPVRASPALGDLKMMLCSQKSYILQREEGSPKWQLVAESKKPLHHKIVQHLFDYATSQRCTKADVVKLRNALHEGKTPLNDSYSCDKVQSDADESDGPAAPWWDELSS